MRQAVVIKTTAAIRVSGFTFTNEILGVLTQNLNSAGFTPHKDDQGSGEVCIANISPRERLKRLVGGLIPFALALGILSWQMSRDVNRLWRLPLFILFVAAASGFFQWRDKA
jgi:hypothetical protein